MVDEAAVERVRALAWNWVRMSYERGCEYEGVGKAVLTELDGTEWCYGGSWANCPGHPAGTGGYPCVEAWQAKQKEKKRG